MSSKKDKEKRREARAKVLALYKELPGIMCRGLCHGTCGTIPVVDAELPIVKKAIKGPIGEIIPFVSNPSSNAIDPLFRKMPDGNLLCGHDDLNCPALTKDKRCGIHAVRPLICRLYGMVDNDKMRCPYGCVPERWISDKEVEGWYARLDKIDRGKE